MRLNHTSLRNLFAFLEASEFQRLIYIQGWANIWPS